MYVCTRVGTLAETPGSVLYLCCASFMQRDLVTHAPHGYLLVQAKVSLYEESVRDTHGLLAYILEQGTLRTWG